MPYTETDRTETVNLREFLEEKMKGLEERMAGQDREMTLRFNALDKALTLSRDDMNRRLEALNQLRNEVITDRGTFMQREICNQSHKDIADWRETVTKKLTILETRSITWTAAVGVFFLILTFVMRWYGK